MPESAIPCRELLPVAFGKGTHNVWKSSEVPKGDSAPLCIASEVMEGWTYFTVDKEYRISVDYPENYLDDIGYAWGHGPGKTDAEGKPLMDKSKPSKIWAFRAWLLKEERMVTAVITSRPLQQAIGQLMMDEDHFFDKKTSFCNWFLLIEHNSNPISKAQTYTCRAKIKPGGMAGNKPALEAAAKPYYLYRHFEGLDAFQPPAEPTEVKPTAGGVRDDNGADIEQPVKDSSKPQKEEWNW